VRDIDGAKLTTEDALAVASATLTAVTVTLGFGVDAGALYSPPEEIVPVTVFPAVTPFTSHETAEFFVPVTIAVNCCVGPAEGETLLGETVTTTAPGLVPFCKPPLQEPNAITIATRAAANVADLMRVLRQNCESNSAALATRQTIDADLSDKLADEVTHGVCHHEASCDSAKTRCFRNLRMSVRC
jgi:hypothetical protein